MKKIYLIFFLFSFIQSNSQCRISGSNSLTVGQIYTFSISSSLAQCSQCHDWDINNSNNSTSGNLQINGSDMNNTVSITALSPGPFNINVTFFNETGCHTCSFSGNASGGINCNASIHSQTCAPYSNWQQPNHNVMLSFSLNLNNPFPNPATVYFGPDTAVYQSGSTFIVAGGTYGMAANGSQISPVQFTLNAPLDFPPGFYVFLEVTYVDNITGLKCTKKLSHLFTSCSGSPYRSTNIDVKPNPYKAGDVLYLDESYKSKDIEILDMNGVRINFEIISDNMIQFYGEKGIYLLRSLNSGNNDSIKIIVN